MRSARSQGASRPSLGRDGCRRQVSPARCAEAPSSSASARTPMTRRAFDEDAEFGTGRLMIDKENFVDLLRDRTDRLLRTINLTPKHWEILAIFGDYEFIAIEDLVGLVEMPDDELKDGVLFLEDNGVLEWESRKYLRLAPYLHDTISRTSWSQEMIDKRRSVAQKILKRATELKSDEIVPLSTIDAGVLASFRDEKQPPSWLAKMVLPFHLLRIAKELYDDKKYPMAAEFCQKALSQGGSLTIDAQVEALRLRGMSLARLGGVNQEFWDNIECLRHVRTRSASRNVHFIQGFRFRLEGRADAAEKEFRSAYSYDNRNFHVLGELAQVLAAQERYDEAELYAREAYAIAPTNVFVIDNLLEILIGSSKLKFVLQEDACG